MIHLLEDAYDPESFRKNGHQLVDLLADYLKGARSDSNLRVLPWKSPEDMVVKWKTLFSH
jgi:L-2,4-diaminobutyrate decarboxylase